MTISTIQQLPPDIRIALKTYVRTNSYSGVDKTQIWLKDQGHLVSRSALGRWLKRLREADEDSGVDPELKLRCGARVLDLFERLEALKKEEQKLLMQIKLAMREV